MAVGLINGRLAADEEARAEVDVLNSRLEKTSQLTKKIQACLARLDATGKSVRDVAGPLSGETRKLQVLGNNIDAVIAAIEKLRSPADSKNDEEQIIRMGPEKAGLPNYLASIKRLNKALNDMKASNLRSTQQTVADLQRLVKTGNSQLESSFDKLLRSETPRAIEPLHYLTKNMPFPVLSQEKITRLGLMNSYLTGVHQQNTGAGSSQESPVIKIYAEVRAQYLLSTLGNLATASTNTAKKKTPEAVYKAGTNGMGTYAQAMEGLFLAEYDNICSIFMREDWGPVFQATCQPALVELGRTLRELNSHIKSHITTDCYLAYEIVEIISSLSSNLENRTGELKSSLAAALKPIRETAKSSLVDLLEETKRQVNSLQTLPADGAPTPLATQTMQRLQSMVNFLRPISSIMISIGDGGWKSAAASKGGATDTIPSLVSFDVGADGQEIFAHYCADTIETLLSSLDARARVLYQQKKAVIGVFLANNVTVIERMINESGLVTLLQSRLQVLDVWRKKATALYTETCKEISIHLFDTVHTNRTARPGSGQGMVSSASIMKGLSSKDKEKIKGMFTAFNSGFEDMVARHKQFTMEKEVRQMLAQDVQHMLEPLYNRFWDRYHEIDKGKGKYVKYDKGSIAAVFRSLY
ncbi:hypothetical protein GE21DRAFT_6238 [Neurospora crassa]|uniref:Exocyst complex protein exo70 n=1 Tax=Neurospora crassa (strain ATCC 24698 / 74-OR23-1A / CBS 708.71 / DSM 1257 / FGSC 987) TaxID=367110 RepID=EXO70_NEUCR|nr:exocyst complex protein EXO70 [Neurospora crassa OR74A]Q6MFS1.2 RecName: Full=Exocyst complex protein exo70 [Neurospora crassa OR74A]EAA33446.3 exocyst complex protein EXO70 [Neurospora crassa OR74A]KHE84421.1 hypothetical protein GE21DRAFT_6238 [Neurospora crassa]|eukprot:XP_962682.3 exocyst complex protein EXO70 [Neurospora crassa OR74A]